MSSKLEKLQTLAAQDPELLDRLLLVAEPVPAEKLITPDRVYAEFRPLLAGLENEHFAAIALDRHFRKVDAAVLTRGCDRCTVVDAKQVYRWALTRSRSVSAVIVAHNHPSGDSTLSAQDRLVTERLVKGGRTLGITMADHLVITNDGYTSMAEGGLIPSTSVDRDLYVK